jgi:hypothetical protein
MEAKMIKTKEGYQCERIELTESQVEQLEEIQSLLLKDEGNSSLMAQVFPARGKMYVLFLPRKSAYAIKDVLSSGLEG